MERKHIEGPGFSKRFQVRLDPPSGFSTSFPLKRKRRLNRRRSLLGTAEVDGFSPPMNLPVLWGLHSASDFVPCQGALHREAVPRTGPCGRL